MGTALLFIALIALYAMLVTSQIKKDKNEK
jgi:hypothetical protein